MTEKNLNTIDERFAESRAFAKKLGYPSGDRWSLPTSTSKFPDGANLTAFMPEPPGHLPVFFVLGLMAFGLIYLPFFIYDRFFTNN